MDLPFFKHAFNAFTRTALYTYTKIHAPFESFAAIEETQDQTNIGSKSLRIGSNLQHNAFEVPYLRFFATPAAPCNPNKSWIDSATK